MANTGTYPLDATSDVGKVRLLIGDVEATNVVNQSADYTYFSDAMVTTALGVADSNYMLAGSVLIHQLALNAGLNGQNLAAGDVKLNTMGVAGSLLEVAAAYAARAGNADYLALHGDPDGIAVIGGPLFSEPLPYTLWPIYE